MAVKPTDPPPPASVSTQRKHVDGLSERREIVRKFIKKYDEEAVWDGIAAKDVPAEIVDYVREQLENGFSYHQIRRQCAILRSTDKSWRKIMSALKQGFRVDGTAFLVQKGFEVQAMSDKLRTQIMDAFEHGIEVPTKNGVQVVKGPSKELAATIDAYNRLQQGFVKLGKDLGAFVDEQSKGGGGVTIVVNNNVPLPNMKDLEAHRAKLKESAQITDAEVVGQDAPNKP